METLQYYVEGKSYKINQIPESLMMKGYFSEMPNETYLLKVCGVARINDQNYLFFPKAYDENKSRAQLNQTGRRLFNALLKYKETIRLSEEEVSWLGDKNKSIQFLNCIKWLINDYTVKGLFKVNEKIVEENGKGRIEWSKTIKTKQPHVIENQFSYLNLTTSKNNSHSDHIISRIHENVILQCIKAFGWLFGIPYEGNIRDIEVGEEQQIILLKKKLRETFTARETRVLEHLISFLEKRISQAPDLILVTPYFHTVWEEMLKQQLGHDETLTALVPRPYWNIGGEKKYTRQIPDILIPYNHDLVIIDAKYYSSVEDYGNFPGWESVVKQMYYNLSLKDKGFHGIRNIFIMPQSLPDGQIFSYIGFTGVEGKEADLGNVTAFSIDIDVVLRDYVTNEKRQDTLLPELVAVIEGKGAPCESNIIAHKTKVCI